jgi:nucleotide-binding universal stress UspA family protein
MDRSILVPLDGSPFGEHALPLALSIARRAAVPLEVIHVHVSLAPVYAESIVAVDNTLEPRLRAQEKSYLDGVVERVRVASTVPVASALLDGSVTEAVQEHVAVHRPEVVVMTTHGRGPFSRFWLGSVADQLMRRLAVPLLLVHPKDEPPDLAADVVPSHVLIPLDGSPLAEQVLDHATELGELLHADYTLLRVVEPMLPAGYGAMGFVVEATDQGALIARRDEAQIYLNRVAEGLRQKGVQVQTRVAVNLSPAEAILEESTKADGTLIALETHGRRGLARLVLGSVADKVVRGTSVPILICRPERK